MAVSLAMNVDRALRPLCHVTFLTEGATAPTSIEGEYCMSEDDYELSAYFTKPAAPATPEEAARDALRLQVYFAEATPAEAERKIKDLRQVSFASKPLGLQVWEFGEYWSPEMAAIWIVTLEANEVERHFCDGDRIRTAWVKNAPHFHPGTVKFLSRVAKYALFPERPHLFQIKRQGAGPEEKDTNLGDTRHHNGYSLADLLRTSMFERYLTFKGKLVDFPPLEKWYPQLQKKLVSGAISAWGVPIGSTQVAQIAPQQWIHATLAEGDLGETLLCSNGDPVFSRIVFRWVDILNEFRPEKPMRHQPWIPIRKYAGRPTPTQQLIIDSMEKTFKEGLPLYFRSKQARNAAIHDGLPEELKGRYKSEHSKEKSFPLMIERTIEAIFGIELKKWFDMNMRD